MRIFDWVRVVNFGSGEWYGFVIHGCDWIVAMVCDVVFLQVC